MQIIKYWEAKDHEAPFHQCFKSEFEARKAAIGHGFYGADATVSKKQIIIWDSYDEWMNSIELEKAKASAKSSIDSLPSDKFKQLEEFLLHL